jgi:F-box/leucine-rich repeat protein 7
MTNKAKSLEEIDLSNCRKVGDNLLARVVGWVVPELSPMEQAAQREYVQQQQQQLLLAAGGGGGSAAATATVARALRSPSQTPAPGTVVGCPALKRLTLSYCKHITDRSMAHIATHAAQRIESIDLTRCTTITDAGFHSWSVWSFPRLTRLCLADCTYLTDNAIVWLTHAARGLRWLDLVSFFSFPPSHLQEMYPRLLPTRLHISWLIAFNSPSAVHCQISQPRCWHWAARRCSTSTWHSAGRRCRTRRYA